MNSYQITGVAVGTTGAFASGTLEAQGVRDCPDTERYPGNTDHVTNCPGSTSIANRTPIPLEDDFPTYHTGIGMVASIQVGPASPASYNSSRISEALSVSYVLQNTCPANYFSECNGSATFTVGQGGSDYGVNFNPANNIFYDDHSLVNAANVLGEAGLTSCTYGCNQTYYAVSDPVGNSCGNTIISNFTIIYTFNTDTIQGTAVTRTTVTEQ